MSLTFVNNQNCEKLVISSFENLISTKDKLYRLINSKEQLNYTIEYDCDELYFNDVSFLKINISYIGKFVFYLKEKNINKSLISDIKALKQYDSSTNEGAVDKLEKLLSIVFELSFIFAIFQPYESGQDIKDYLLSFFKRKEKYLFYVEEKQIPLKTEGCSFKGLLINNKFRWLLVFISGLILGCNISFGVFKIYQGNIGIAALLILTVLVGCVAIYISHYDIFISQNKINKKEFVICILFDLFSAIMGYLLFICLYFVTEKDKSDTYFLRASLISSLSCLLSYTLVIIICYKISKYKK